MDLKIKSAIVIKALRILVIFLSVSVYGQETEVRYLSGTGADHRVEWEFHCDKGRNSGRWTTIPVPSCWEQEGFGSYNYGHDDFGTRLNEQGRYRHRFTVPEAWRDREIRLVFEGVMTDALVTVNGISAGPVHQGAFYEFGYDVSGLLRIGGENVLEVLVKKHSDNASVSLAERKADFWVFGGIFRPVYLSAKPRANIQRVAIDAKADGSFRAAVHTSAAAAAGYRVQVAFRTLDGLALGTPKAVALTGPSTPIAHAVDGHRPWNPEQPSLYEAVFALLTPSGTVCHAHVERFGFRTVEVRESDGIYVNGTRVKLKGVNRHTFHPDHGRTSSKRLSIEAVEAIKDMNMNAVRMSHYPPDRHFLAACDSLGLFVLDELTAWQKPSYDDTVGLRLLTEMIRRDVNHPSVIFWCNGNEGGENPNLTAHFRRLDIQRREVLYPWADFGPVNTAHYIDYDYLALDGYGRRKVFFPTEFLHGLYDGGHGAGLEDYWLRMWEHPLAAGGFLWVFQDEAVARTDRGGALDTDGSHAPDGILGPYGEKEASYYAIKDIWSPVHIEKRYVTPAFNGVLRIENRYHYTDLDQVLFRIEWTALDGEGETTRVADSVRLALPPGQRGELRIPLPEGWQRHDVLRLRAVDASGRTIADWHWPVKRARDFAAAALAATGAAEAIAVEESDTAIHVRYGTHDLAFRRSDGTLRRFARGGAAVPLPDGPILVGSADAVRGVSWHRLGDTVAVLARLDGGSSFSWKITGDGRLGLEVAYAPEDGASVAGITFAYPADDVAGMAWVGDGPYRVYKNRMRGVRFGRWEKEPDATVTGDSGYRYPEFAGYHANVYWASVRGRRSPGFEVHVHTDDIFLRMLTPALPADPRHTAVAYPAGDISFLNAINGPGTKFSTARQHGPQGAPTFFDARKVVGGKVRLHLTFILPL